MSRRILQYESQGGPPEDDDDLLDGGAELRTRAGRLEVLLVGDGFTVVNKPAGMPTIPDREGLATTAIDALHALWRREDPDRPAPVVCHRLDKDTSGCLVLAHDRAAARELMSQFRAHTVEKSYLALTLGAPQPPAGAIEIRVRPDKYRPGSMYVVKKGGKPSPATYETVEAFRGVSLVRVRPSTGRTHQVRLTLRELGAPCVVDPLYGSADPLLLSRWKRAYRTGRGRDERPLMARLTLHAESITFAPLRPTPDAQRITCEAPLPRDFAATLTQLRKHAAPGSL
jgi:RluA family pseudouridine synthase